MPPTVARERALLAAPEPELRLTTGRAAAVYFALAFVYFLPAMLPGRNIFGTDYLAGSYFYYEFVHTRVTSGSLAKWVPYVFGGLPFFSNPGSGFYPVRWLADLLGSTRLFFPLLFWIQFGLAGLGMFLLARALGSRGWVALLAGLAWQWTGITTSWVYAGHDGRIIVVTLAPLVLYFIHEGVRRGRFGAFVGLAATLALALLSFQIQNAWYLLVASLLWAVFLLVHFAVHREPARLARTVGLGLGAVAFAFLTASVNFLPFVEYAPHSVRGGGEGRGYEFATSYSMPPRAVLGLAVPEQVGVTVTDEAGQYVFPVYRGENAFRLHTEYVGALALLGVLLALVYARRSRYVWFFGGLSLFALSLALGGNTPLYRLWFETLPGLRRFRAPDLAFYLIALSFVSMAAVGLEALAAARDEARARRGRSQNPFGPVLWATIGLAGAAVLGAVSLGAASAGMAEGTAGLTPALGWMRFALFAALTGGALVLWTRGSLTTTAAALLLALVTTADLWAIGKRFFMTVEGPEQMFAADDVVAFLQAQPGADRIWAFPHPQHYRGGGAHGSAFPMIHGLAQAGGEHSTPMQRYVEFVGVQQGPFPDWHNFLAEPAVVETPQGQAITFRSTPGFLEAANIRYVVAMAPLALPNLREVHRGSALVYENTAALRRAYLVPNAVRVPAERTLATMLQPGWNPAETAVVESERDLVLPSSPLEGTAEVVRHEPDRVEVRTRSNRAAYLVLADNFHPDWRATVDGQPVEIHRANHTFRGLVVPAGEHTVVYTFHPARLYTGLYIHLACVALLLAAAAVLVVRSRRRAPDPAAA